MAAGIALGAKRRQRGKSSWLGADRGGFESMDRQQLYDVAQTKRKALPVRQRR